MMTVNAMGDACPIPVVKTKKAMETLKAGDVVETYVDNEIAVENLTKMAKQTGCAVTSQKLDEGKYNAFGLAPYARYSYYENKVVRLFIDGGLGFSTQKVKGADAVNGFEIGFKPGIAIKLNDKFSVLAKCGFLGYRDDYMNAGSGYGFNFTSEDLSFGFHYEF